MARPAGPWNSAYPDLETCKIKKYKKGLSSICHHDVSNSMNRDCRISQTKWILQKQTALGVDFHQHMWQYSAWKSSIYCLILISLCCSFKHIAFQYFISIWHIHNGALPECMYTKLDIMFQYPCMLFNIWNLGGT